jgi:hypothetical protein
MSNPSREGFYFFLASDHDSEYLFAEVYYGDYRGDFSVCVVGTEKGDFEITFYNDSRINSSYDYISMNLSGFMLTLDRVKEELKNFATA